MIKKIFLFLFMFIAICFVAGVMIIPTDTLFEISVKNYYRDYWLRKPAFFYLQHFRGLKDYRRVEQGPPLHSIMRDCIFVVDPTCSEVLEWAISEGEDINEIDDSLLGFTPLHYSGYNCDPISAAILLSKNARRDSQATGENFKGRTPFDVFNLMKNITCSDLKIKEDVEKLLNPTD